MQCFCLNEFVSKKMACFVPCSIDRLNSGTKNRNNFFVWAIFLIQKVGINSVIYADSGDIKILVRFPGNSILKIFQNF